MNKINLKILLPFIIFLILINVAKGMERTNPDNIHNRPWDAYWIEVPGESQNSYGVYLFRKDLNFKQVPSSFIINVSADNRYKLYINGKLVSLGPSRGDVLHWRYETVDIGRYLKPGKNVLAAVVWNDGNYRSIAQMSYQTGFIIQGNSDLEDPVNTNNTWKCIKDSAYKPLQPRVIGYYAAPPGEYVDMNRHDLRWNEINYNDSSWKNARQISHGNPKGVFTFDYGWMLVPSPIPPMELKKEKALKVREENGISVPGKFLSGDTLTIPENTNASLLLDQTYLTDAYPTLEFSGGKDAAISIKYAEALYSEKKDSVSGKTEFFKTNRNYIAGKVFIGLEDSLTSNGDINQTYTSLWWRAYRYILIKVRTKNEPLTIKNFYGTYTGYPFKLNAKFESTDSTLGKILKVGWRTARLCAFETYMDCPYYEQLQYAGDTRIQALISYFDSGDRRLAKNAINLLDESRIAAGLTESRYPSASTQLIPPFSLRWIGMLHDYWMYTPDSRFVKSKLSGERQVLSFFERFQRKDGSINSLPYWGFTDWVNSKGWNHGVPPIGRDGSSSILDLQLLRAYELAAQMEDKLGMKAFAGLYESRALQLKKTILKKYWDKGRQEFADTPDKKSFSQHANALAILTGVVEGKEAQLLGNRIVKDSALTQATVYFSYYVNRALVKAGLGNLYLNQLDVWKENLKYGMSTFAEYSDLQHTRSDCHGWSASPNIEFFRTVLGIDSYAPGFKVVKIEPHLGSLNHASGEIPHPQGKIAVDYKLKDGKWKINIDIPERTSGFLIWKGKKYKLTKEVNQFILN